MKTWLLALVLLLGLENASAASYDRKKPNRPDNDNQAYGRPVTNDQQVVKAVQRKGRVHYIQGVDMEVVQLLPDDLNGSQHQKFVVRLSSGDKVMIVYNLDLCPKVPLRVGDRVAAGGEFIWTKGGGLLHWVHYDPKANRPHGYVSVGGKAYCSR